MSSDHTCKTYFDYTQQMWLHLPKNFGTVVIVLHGVLYEAEPIDIAHKGVAIGSEEVETAHRLLWG